MMLSSERVKVIIRADFSFLPGQTEVRRRTEVLLELLESGIKQRWEKESSLQLCRRDTLDKEAHITVTGSHA